MAECLQEIQIKSTERLLLESRFDDIINRLWCDEEKQKYLSMRDEILKDISDEDLKERLDHFQTTCDNMELAEKYLTIAVTNAMEEAEEDGQTGLADYLLNAEGDLKRIYIRMNQTLDNTDDLAALHNDEVDLKKIIFGHERSLDQYHELQIGMIIHHVIAPVFSLNIDQESSMLNFNNEETPYVEINCTNNLGLKNEVDPAIQNEEILDAKNRRVSLMEGNSSISDNGFDPIVRLKEWQHHLDYMLNYKRTYNKLKLNANILGNITPAVDLKRVCNKFINTYHLTSHLLTNEVGESFQNISDDVIHRPYTKDKIDIYYKYYVAYMQKDLNDNRKRNSWCRVLYKGLINFQFSAIQTLNREFLSTLGFPTLIPQQESCSNEIIKNLENQIKVSDPEEFLNGSIQFSSWNIELLKKAINSGKKWIYDIQEIFNKK